MEAPSRKRRRTVSVESVEDFINRGGRIKKIGSPEIKDSGKFGKLRWQYTMNEVRPQDPDVLKMYRRIKGV